MATRTKLLQGPSEQPPRPQNLVYLEHLWPRAISLVPLPHQCFRPDGIDVPVTKRTLLDDQVGGLPVGLSKCRVKDEQNALQQAFD